MEFWFHNQALAGTSVCLFCLFRQDDGWLMGMKQDDWQQNRENSTKGVFPENFTQRLWNRNAGTPLQQPPPSCLSLPPGLNSFLPSLAAPASPSPPARPPTHLLPMSNLNKDFGHIDAALLPPPGQRSHISKESASLCYRQVFENIVPLQKSLIPQVPLSEAEPLRRRGCIILNSCLVISSPKPTQQSLVFISRRHWEAENMQCQV